jgi:hypothetical protein
MFFDTTRNTGNRGETCSNFGKRRILVDGQMRSGSWRSLQVSLQDRRAMIWLNLFQAHLLATTIMA